MTATAAPIPADSSTIPRVTDRARELANSVTTLFTQLRANIHQVFVGQHELVDFILYALLANGHVLIEGVPGLGKTLMVRTLADSLEAPMSRIQFTPDLMPADITGTTVLAEKSGGGHELKFQPGPLVSSIVLADEINRSSPKTQSALLEAMQERQISVAGRTIQLPHLFMVLATQNPLEQEGTYPLPEAQLDRFLVKLLVEYPTEAEYHTILESTTGPTTQSKTVPLSSQAVLDARVIVRDVPVSELVRTYAIRLVMATQPASVYAPPLIKEHVACGAGPRAAQALLLLAKVRALIDCRFTPSCRDVRDVAAPVLRHRMILNFTALADRITPDDLVGAAISAIPETSQLI